MNDADRFLNFLTLTLDNFPAVVDIAEVADCLENQEFPFNKKGNLRQILDPSNMGAFVSFHDDSACVFLSEQAESENDSGCIMLVHSKLSLKILFFLLRGFLHTRTDLAIENMALRQQLNVLRRSVKRVRLRKRDRVFWAVL